MTINVSNFSPAPGSTISLGGSLRFDVTFSPSSSAGPHAIIAAYGNSSFELVWDGEGFVAPYAASSRVALAGGGWRYTVRRTGRFPAAPIISVREFGRTRPGSLEPVRFVVTGNADFNGEADGYALTGLTDGVTPANGDRCAFMFQDDKTENGIYVVSGGVARARADDFGDVLGVSFAVLEGAVYKGSTWQLSEPVDAIEFGVSDIVFVRTDVSRYFADENTIQIGRVTGVDGNNVGDPGEYLYLRPGRTQNDLHVGQPFGNAKCWANTIVEMGVAGRDTNGETSSVNFMYGDTRIATIPPFIAYEHGFYGVDGYNPDPVTGVELKPHGWRTHSSEGIGYLIQGHRDLTLESVVGPVQTNVVNGQHIGEGFSVSGGGVYHRRRGFKGVSSGTTPLAINLGDLIPSAHMAHCRAYVACLPSDFSSFECFAVKWTWFRSNVAASIISDFAGIGGYTAPGTRIPSPTDDGGPVNFNVVGLSGKTMTWSIVLEYDFYY